MFGQLGWDKILLVAVVGLVVLGPDKLPHYAREAGRMLRQLRAMANNATAEIKAELGPELGDLDVRDLHPKTMLRKFIEAEDEDTAVTSTMPTAPTAPAAEKPAGQKPTYDDVT